MTAHFSPRKYLPKNVHPTVTFPHNINKYYMVIY
jgi:hypothetical protein